MKTGILICTHNRPEYLEQTLESLRLSNTVGCEILIVDDASTDPKTLELIQRFNYIRIAKNSSIRNSIQVGFEYLFSNGCELVINLDSDTLVRNDFVDVIKSLHLKFPNQIVTGFNCNTLNKNGSIRHKVESDGVGYNIKKSVGGVNMAVNRSTYERFIKKGCEKGGNWDHESCKLSEAEGLGVVCSVPSVVQHIGYNSSMGHSNVEKPDTADDFKPLSLPNVTLIGIDCKDVERLVSAIESSTKGILFGSVKLLSSVDHPKVTDKIKHISSKEAYSEFCIKELYKYVDTDFMLVIQYDGYVINYKAWDDKFLDFDYIGAPWEWLDKNNVGNGGFSLRSRKLMKLASEIISEYHPEDQVICDKYSEVLISNGIKFAPIDLARNFSIEGYKSDKRYRGQFGFHGTGVKFKTDTKKLCVLQPFGLGDVIFCQTLAHSFSGYDITWPVKDHFVEDLNRAYPDINFIPEKSSPVDLAIKKTTNVNGYRVLPIRWSDKIQNVPYSQVMRAKYDMYRLNWKSWKERALWKRDYQKEDDLFRLLDLEGKEYNLLNMTFGCDFKGKIQLEQDGIELTKIEGYSLFDWAKVFENAKEIHTVSTSILYILDMLKTGNVHVYIRKPQEKNHNNYKYIFTNPKFIYSI